MRCTEDKSVTVNVCIRIGIAGVVCQELPVPSVHTEGYLIGSLISEIESVLWEMSSIPDDSQHNFMCKQLLYSHRQLALTNSFPSGNLKYSVLNNIVQQCRKTASIPAGRIKSDRGLIHCDLFPC